MLFHIFDSQEERRRFGGSAFVEMQFCRLQPGTKIEDLVSVDSITHWQNDSLYIDDENAFYREYSDIFDCGIYNNLNSGTVDIYGINYYAPTTIDTIINRVLAKKPAECQVLLQWLNNAKQHNGFYILGL